MSKETAQARPSDAMQRLGGASTGALLAIVIGGVCASFGHPIPNDLAVAIGSLIGSSASEIFRSANAYLNRGVETVPADQVHTFKAYTPTVPADPQRLVDTQGTTVSTTATAPAASHAKEASSDSKPQ